MIWNKDNCDRYLHTSSKSINDKTNTNAISQTGGSRKISTAFMNPNLSKILYESSSTPMTIDELNLKSNTNSNILFKNGSMSSSRSYINTFKYAQGKKKKKNSLKPFQENNPLTIIESVKQLEDQSPSGQIAKNIKIIDIIVGFLAIFSIIFSIIDNELFISKSNQYIKTCMNENNESSITLSLYKRIEERKLTSCENTIRFLNCITSLTGSILIIFRYKNQLLQFQNEKKLSEYDGIISSGFLPYIIIEVIICGVCYPPFINKVFEMRNKTIIYVYSLNSIYSIFSLSKIYLLIKIIFYLSRYNTRISQAICKNHNISPGLQFIIKCEMKLRPLISMSTVTIGFLLLFGFTTMAFEYSAIDEEKGLEGKKGINDLANIFNCIWLIAITMTTVGYGDEFPRTNLGRVVVFFGCAFGMLGVGLTIACIKLWN